MIQSSKREVIWFPTHLVIFCTLLHFRVDIEDAYAKNFLPLIR